MEPLLLTRVESAALLRVSLRTLDLLVSTKQLPSRKVGRRRLIPRAELERFARRDHPTRQSDESPRKQSVAHDDC